jgi:hypothetical protein
MHNALKDSVVGYAMELRQKGATIWTAQWNWAQAPGDGSLGWTPDRQMHVANVSKLTQAYPL